MNQINVIVPYKDNGGWVFDDPRFGLDKEPFISGADLVLDHMVSHLSLPEHGFMLIFSDRPFPSHQHHLVWMREEHDGNWYQHLSTKEEGWLCPALEYYFDDVPAELFVEAKAIGGK